MRRARRRALPTLRAPELAQLLAKHEQCEVRYHRGKHKVVRRWNDNARSDTLHEASELNHNALRKAMKHSASRTAE